MSILLLATTIIVLAAVNSDYRTKHLAETIDNNTEEITMIMLSYPMTTTGKYKATKEQKKIDTFINFLDHVE